MAILENKEVMATGVQTDPIIDLQGLKKDNEALIKSLHETRGELSIIQAELLKCKEDNLIVTDQLSILRQNEGFYRNVKLHLISCKQS